MKPIRTPEMDDTMVGPEGSAIGPLPCLLGDGVTFSVWELDEKEKAQLAEGGRILLGVMANPTPPVILGTTPPYCDACGGPMQWEEVLMTYTCCEEEHGCEGCGEVIDPDETAWVVGPPVNARFYHLRCRPPETHYENGSGGSGQG